MDIKVTKRGNKLQFTSSLKVGDETVEVKVCRFVDATDEEELQRDLAEAMRGGQEDLLGEARRLLHQMIRRGEEASRVSDSLRIGVVEKTTD